jgi:hypothetical protein
VLLDARVTLLVVRVTLLVVRVTLLVVRVTLLVVRVTLLVVLRYGGRYSGYALRGTFRGTIQRKC